MIFKRNRKGEQTISTIVGWLIGLALLAILLYAIFTAWNSYKQTTTTVASCSGGGITQGKCMASSSACDGLAIEGLGCKGETPVCCASNT